MESAEIEDSSPGDVKEELDTSLGLSDEQKDKNAVLKYVQEKKNLQSELEQKDKTVNEYKVKVYDLSNKIKSLEQDIASLKKEKRNPPLSKPPRSPAIARTGVVRPSKGKARNNRAKTAKTRNKLSVSSHNNLTERSSSSAAATPDLQDSEEEITAVKTLERYKEVAELYPDLKLSVILRAEKVFFEADINHDGTIDEEELEKLLEKQGHYMTTKKEVKQIMTEIDKDDTGTIDLMEYMAVMERVQQRKRTNLPPALTKSTVCAIQ